MRGLILAFVFGVWCLQQMPELPHAWSATVLLPLAVAAWMTRAADRSRYRLPHRLLLLAIGLATGFLFAAAVAHVRLGDALPPAWEGRDIQVVGVVASLPRLQERSERFQFDVEHVETDGAKVPRHISVARYFAGFRQQAPVVMTSEFHAGERWRLTLKLKRPHGSYNPYGGDFEVWALEHQVRATGYVRKSDTNARLDAMVYRPAYLIERLREQVRDRFHRVLGDSRHIGVLLALAIGDDSEIPVDDWQVFLRTGVNHLVSISGLHVTMVASLAMVMVYACWRRVPRLTLRLPARKAGVLAGVIAAGGYALIAGYAVPTQRTFYMLAVIALALWTGRVASMSRVLCLALLVVVLLDPWAVLAAGFWLSFAAVGLLVYAGSARLGRRHWLREAVHTQWVVTLGLTPLLLALFQQASIISPLANAFAIPVISLLVTPLALLGAVIPVDYILLAAHAVMAWCMALLEYCAALPDAVWQQHAPPVWTVLVAMFGVLWLLLPRGFPMRWLGGIAFAPMFLVLPPAPAAGELRATVLDVGQGLAVVLQTARHAMLFDTGPRYSEDVDSGTRVILPYLRGVGIAHLDGLVLSHDDNDHTGGAMSVLQGIPVGWLASPLPPGHLLLRDVRRPLTCFDGQSWQWDGVRFDMLHPGAESYGVQELKDNDRSCVLKVVTAHGSLLIPADIERASELELLERHPQLRADVLLAPHHGSKTSSTVPFVEQVRPAYTVFAMGYRNRFGHPKAEVVQRYEDVGSRLLRSDRDGAVQFEFSGRGIALQSWRETRRRYWHDRVAENGGAG